jgi:Fe2+ or Zn2+ uptake regulation protein
LTQPRRQLLRLICEQTSPFSAPGLEKKLRKNSGKKDSCDPVTIYRTLPLLEELGIIERCGFSEDMAYYEVILNHKGHHHHIVCSACHKVEPLNFCAIEGQEQVLKKMGYTDLSHRLEFVGKCPACSAESISR